MKTSLTALLAISFASSALGKIPQPLALRRIREANSGN